MKIHKKVKKYLKSVGMLLIFWLLAIIFFTVLAKIAGHQMKDKVDMTYSAYVNMVASVFALAISAAYDFFQKDIEEKEN